MDQDQTDTQPEQETTSSPPQGTPNGVVDQKPQETQQESSKNAPVQGQPPVAESAQIANAIEQQNLNVSQHTENVPQSAPPHGMAPQQAQHAVPPQAGVGPLQQQTVPVVHHHPGKSSCFTEIVGKVVCVTFAFLIITTDLTKTFCMFQERCLRRACPRPPLRTFPRLTPSPLSLNLPWCPRTNNTPLRPAVPRPSLSPRDLRTPRTVTHRNRRDTNRTAPRSSRPRTLLTLIITSRTRSTSNPTWLGRTSTSKEVVCRLREGWRLPRVKVVCTGVLRLKGRWIERRRSTRESSRVGTGWMKTVSSEWVNEGCAGVSRVRGGLMEGWSRGCFWNCKWKSLRVRFSLCCFHMEVVAYTHSRFFRCGDFRTNENFLDVHFIHSHIATLVSFFQWVFENTFALIHYKHNISLFTIEKSNKQIFNIKNLKINRLF